MCRVIRIRYVLLSAILGSHYKQYAIFSEPKPQDEFKGGGVSGYSNITFDLFMRGHPINLTEAVKLSAKGKEAKTDKIGRHEVTTLHVNVFSPPSVKFQLFFVVSWLHAFSGHLPLAVLFISLQLILQKW